MWRRIFVGVLLLGSVAAAQGRAVDTSPGVGPLGIRLERANCVEAVAVLRTASRLPIDFALNSPARPLSEETRARLETRFSFDWSDVTAAEALEALGQRYGVWAWVGPGGVFSLWPAEDPREAWPVRPTSQVEVNGLRIGVGRAVIHSVTPARPLDDQLHLGVEVRPGGRDAFSLAHVENVTAVDDRGRVLRDRDMQRGVAPAFARPGRCTFGVTLPPPHASEKRLVSVQGDLYAYRNFRRYRIEMPLPLRRSRSRWREGGFGFELLAVRPGTGSADDGLMLGGPVVVGRLSCPPGTELGEQLASPGLSGFPFPLLVGASGRIYSGGRASGSPAPEGFPADHAKDLEWTFPRIEEPLVRFEFHLLQRDAIERIATFRLRDIPLPPEQPGGSAGDVSLTTTPLADGHSLYQRDGAELVSPVRVGDRPAPPGIVYFGLTPQAELGGQASTWFEAPVKGGVAVLTGLWPGTYRLLRLYQPTGEGGALPGDWTGAETFVTVPQGKVTLPALRLQKNGTSRPPAKSNAPPEPVAPAPVERKQHGITVSEVRSTLWEDRSVRFVDPPELRHTGNTRLTLSGMTTPEFSDRLVRVVNVVARDDQGRLFTAAQLPVTPSHRLWHTAWALPRPASGVRRLDWIEGDFLYWSRVEPVKLEIPLKPLPSIIRRQVGPVHIELKLAPGEADDELRKADPAHQKGLRISGSITAPPEVRMEAPEGKKLHPLLIDASGNSHAVAGVDSGLERGGKGTRYRIDGHFPVLTEPAEKLRLEWVLKSEVRRAGSFRVHGVVLPVKEPPMGAK